MVLLATLIFLPIVTSIIAYGIGRASLRAVRYFALAVSVVVLGLALYAIAIIHRTDSGGVFTFQEHAPWIPVVPGLDYWVGIDGLGAVMVLISALLTVFVILGSWDLIQERQPLYYMLILLFEGAIIGVFVSLNLILFYVFWELVLVPMFFFIGLWGGPRRKYAAMKFFLFTFVGSLGMLLGFLAVYLFADVQTFNFIELYGRIPVWVQLWASVAVFFGFGVKLPVVPLHTWLPDAHVEAPAPISVFLAGLLLKMGGYGFIRFNVGLFPGAAQQLAWVFITIGLVTMFYGALVAMIQRDLKRMIALTSINHMGFVMLGAFAGIIAPNLQGAIFGLSGAVFQMFNHAAAIGILFMLSGYVHHQAGTRDIRELRGLKTTMPRTALLLLLGSLAGMGVPVFSSFLSEWMVIFGAIAVNFWLAIAVLVPGLTVAYFLWMLWRTTLSDPMPGSTHHDMSQFSAFHLSLYLVPLFLLLLFPWLILNVVNPLTTSVVGAVLGD
jgi:NADH-quinone oxidoreductase subunit M